MIEVFVESIRVNMTNYKRVVMLKEKLGDRFLPAWIGHFEADPPTFRWFVGGRTNLAYNCVDHHVAMGRGARPALA